MKKRFMITLELVYEDNRVYDHPERWNWKTLLDLQADETVEVKNCILTEYPNQLPPVAWKHRQGRMVADYEGMRLMIERSAPWSRTFVGRIDGEQVTTGPTPVFCKGEIQKIILNRLRSATQSDVEHNDDESGK